MTLASRLTRFFLAALAVVLTGFSLALYALSFFHLHRLVDERLDAALVTLSAATEVGPDSVEWEPGERPIDLGRDQGPDEVRWAVFDPAGLAIDRSINFNPRRLPLGAAPGATRRRLTGADGRPWRTRLRKLVPAVAAGGENRQSVPPAYASLTLVAYVPLGPTEATLRSLAATTAGLSLALWLAAFAGARRLCRRALEPLTRMAEAARAAGAAEPGARLPAPATADELEELGRAFNGLLDRLHEALARQRGFTGDASHQLRTPLAGLLAQVDVALRRDRAPEEYRRVLGVVRAKASQLRQVVDSLLFLARADSESARPQTEPIELTGWLAERHGSWSDHARAGDLRLVTFDIQGSAWVKAHPPLLAQAFDNLIDNAFKYSESGSPVVVKLSVAGVSAIVSIHDQGRGIDPADVPHLFEPFYRAGMLRPGDQGIGLGLSVASRVVSVFGGRIDVESLPGRGSVFSIMLPLADPPEQPVSEEESIQPAETV